MGSSSKGTSPLSNTTVAHKVQKQKHNEEQEDYLAAQASKAPRWQAETARPRAESTPQGSEPIISPGSRSIANLAGTSTSNTPAHHSQGSAKRARTHQPGKTDLPYRSLPDDGSKKACGPYSFLSLPAEIRNIIYHLVLGYPDCSQLYSVYYGQIRSQDLRNDSKGESEPQERPVFDSKFHTPSILLLCRRITEECLPILKSHTFIINRLPPFRSSKMWKQEEGGGTQMRLSQFVGRATLQNLQHLDLRVGVCEGPIGSAWLWKRVVDELHEILLERNRLVTMRLLFRICNERAHPGNWNTEAEYMNYMLEVSTLIWHPGVLTGGTGVNFQWTKRK